MVIILALLVPTACGVPYQSARSNQIKTGEQALSLLSGRIRQYNLYQGRFAYK
jgi:hypothetical protein